VPQGEPETGVIEPEGRREFMRERQAERGGEGEKGRQAGVARQEEGD
jgi:hypothetical protein